MFDKLKSLMEAQKKAAEIKKFLEAQVVTAESADGSVKAVVSGTQEVKDVRLGDDFKQKDKVQLERAVTEAVNKALKESQEVAVRKMKDTIGFGLPGGV